MFKKRKIVYTLDEMISLINKYNGILDIFLSLYAIKVNNNRASYEDTTIDKIFFDFDSKEGLDNVKKFHDYATKENLTHKVLFTGRGFHAYIFTTTTKLKNPKAAISNAQRDIAEKLDFKIGEPKTSDIDNHIIGDVARIARFPNTINLKSKLYCIHLPKEFKDMNLQEIKDLARHPQYVYPFLFGEKMLDMTKYDKEMIASYLPIVPTGDAENINENFPPCIKYLLSKGECGYRDRYHIIIYLRDKAFSKKETIRILKKYLSPQKFKHCVYEERQVDSLYRNADKFYVTREELKRDNCCFDCKDCSIDNMYKTWNTIRKRGSK